MILNWIALRQIQWKSNFEKKSVQLYTVSSLWELQRNFPKGAGAFGKSAELLISEEIWKYSMFAKTEWDLASLALQWFSTDSTGWFLT